MDVLLDTLVVTDVEEVVVVGVDTLEELEVLIIRYQRYDVT